MRTTIKTYTELIQIPTFEERFNYLRLNGKVCDETFGFDRCINQRFYKGNPEWQSVREKVIIRDNGCDLACADRQINKFIFVHHMNPITIDDIRFNTDILINPEYLICCSRDTHNAIHYGDESLLLKDYKPRSPGDTTPWK